MIGQCGCCHVMLTFRPIRSVWPATCEFSFVSFCGRLVTCRTGTNSRWLASHELQVLQWHRLLICSVGLANHYLHFCLAVVEYFPLIPLELPPVPQFAYSDKCQWLSSPWGLWNLLANKVLWSHSNASCWIDCSVYSGRKKSPLLGYKFQFSNNIPFATVTRFLLLATVFWVPSPTKKLEIICNSSFMYVFE